MKRIWFYVLGAVVVAGAAVAVAALRGGGASSFDFDVYAIVSRPPQIAPDYAGVTVPANIAPLNFTVQEPGDAYLVRIAATTGTQVEVRSTEPRIVIPSAPWRQLLAANRGQSLSIDVYARGDDGTWQGFSTITSRIAAEDIDRYLVYRLIPPMHHAWRKIGIYQRSLESFGLTTVIENRNFGRNGCVNCHTFKQNSTSAMSFQIRSPDHGRPMMIVKDGEIRKVDTSTGEGISAASYHAWHPNGEIIAFARIKPMPFEHTALDARDVWDADSDLAVYFTEDNRVETPPGIAASDRRETWPSWSSDGRSLYFSSAPQVPFTNFSDVRYDLMRISYDPATNIWGEPEVLVAAAETGLSALEPRESPDGNWLLFCLCQYGNFPVFQRSSDLYLMDLKAEGRPFRRLEINSDRSDSWHSWSSNSRWVAFASKRDGELLSRVYFSYVDAKGRFSKPFVLPQRDPEFYDSFTLTFNVPELVKDRIPVTRSQLGRAIADPAQVITATAGPGAAPVAAAAEGPDTTWEPAAAE